MKREQVDIISEFIKLDALLKFTGAAMTGGHAKDMIVSGEVKVNGEVCEQRGRKIYPGMLVAVEDTEYEVTARAD
jgi:ribosome-associated protein